MYSTYISNRIYCFVEIVEIVAWNINLKLQVNCNLYTDSDTDAWDM